MPRFLIEIPHEASGAACVKAVEIVLSSGSHLFTKADWGCKDGVHKGWVVVDVGDKREAQGIVPPAIRSQAKIVQLNTFTLEEIRDIGGHQKS